MLGEVTERGGFEPPMDVKDSNLKVQAQIQGDELRISGKKKDDLQAVMQLVKDADVDLPLQFTNFRD